MLDALLATHRFSDFSYLLPPVFNLELLAKTLSIALKIGIPYVASNSGYFEKKKNALPQRP